MSIDKNIQSLCLNVVSGEPTRAEISADSTHATCNVSSTSLPQYLSSGFHYFWYFSNGRVDSTGHINRIPVPKYDKSLTCAGKELHSIFMSATSKLLQFYGISE